MATQRPKAFIIAGGTFMIKSHNWAYSLLERGLAILDIEDPFPDQTERLAKILAEYPENLLHKRAEVAYVKPDNMAGVVEVGRRWNQQYEIVGSISLTEKFVEPLGLLNACLGLPSPGLQATLVLRDKALQRQFLAEWSPKSRSFEQKQELEEAAKSEEISYPFVLKPTRRMASSGVVFIENATMLENAIGQYTEQESLLLEEFIDGPEYSIETLVQNGKIIFEGITEKGTNSAERRFFVETHHTVPAQRITEQDRSSLKAVSRAIHERVAFQDGVSHGEYKLADGKVYLMEIAARSPGDMIFTVYHLAHGEPIEPQIIKIALGEPARYPPARRVARQVYLHGHEGMLRDVQLEGFGVSPRFFREHYAREKLVPNQAEAPPSLQEVLLEMNRDQEIPATVGESSHRMGYFLIEAADVAGLDALEASVQQAMHVEVTPVEK